MSTEYFHASKKSNLPEILEPTGYYEEVREIEEGTWIAVTERYGAGFVESEIPEVAFSKTPEGALLGSIQNTRETGTYYLYATEEIPEVDLSKDEYYDFGLLDEVRYRRKVKIKRIGFFECNNKVLKDVDTAYSFYMGDPSLQLVTPFEGDRDRILRIKKQIARGIVKTSKRVKKTGMDYEEDSDYYEMTPEDFENIRQMDKLTSDEALDLSSISHPEEWENIKGKGMFFIGGDTASVDLLGNDYPFGLGYAEEFSGWAVGKGKSQIFQTKANEGYYYVGIVSYRRSGSLFKNKAYLNAMDRRLKDISENYIGVSYNLVKEEAIHDIEEQKRKEYRSSPQEDLFNYSDITPEVVENIKFYKRVLKILKKRESEDIKERGGNTKKEVQILIKNIENEIAEEVSSRAHSSRGMVVGVGKFAEALVGEDRRIKHEIYPEEIIFNNYKRLPEPIPVERLFPALQGTVKDKDIEKTFWVKLQTYNLTVDKSDPLVRGLMDFADSGVAPVSKIGRFVLLKSFLTALCGIKGDMKKFRAVMLGDYEEVKREPFVLKVARIKKLNWDKLQKLAMKKTSNFEGKTRDGQSVRLELDKLSDYKQRENFLKHYMNGSFEVDGIWHSDLDPIEQGKMRIHFNNLKYV